MANFFKYIKLRINSYGEFEIRYICKYCGVEMYEPYDYTVPCTYSGMPEYHKSEFICNKCKEKGNNNEA